MESKQSNDDGTSQGFCAFNRTSMESKRVYGMALRACLHLLLIEPVWNRNVFTQQRELQNEKLLIEPVWNRN